MIIVHYYYYIIPIIMRCVQYNSYQIYLKGYLSISINQKRKTRRCVIIGI
jgi:hypothetical protein